MRLRYLLHSFPSVSSYQIHIAQYEHQQLFSTTLYNLKLPKINDRLQIERKAVIINNGSFFCHLFKNVSTGVHACVDVGVNANVSAGQKTCKQDCKIISKTQKKS